MDGNPGGSSVGCSTGRRRICPQISESSQVFNPARGAGLSSGGLIDSNRIGCSTSDEVTTSQTENFANSSSSSSLVKTIAGRNQVKDLSAHTTQHQSDKIKIKTNHHPVPLIEKSQSGKTRRLSNPKYPTSLFRSRSGTIRISEQRSMQQLTATTRSLKDHHRAGLAKTSTSSRTRTAMHFVKQEQTQSPKNPSMHSLQRKETAQPPRWLVKNVETSRIPVSMHRMQKKETTQFAKHSAAFVNKSETTSRRILEWKQFTQKREKTQPYIATCGVVSKSGTATTLPSKAVTQTKETSPAKPEQKQLTYKHYIAKPRQKRNTYKNHYAKPRQKQRKDEDHITWEGLDEQIVPLEKSCVLCDEDLSREPEYDPNREQLNPAENAVLSCGHVFHNLCLLYATSEENPTDPSCIICASILS